jgi:hypothetical protein
MEQYRTRFVHNHIDGRLLLTLDDKLLKAELGIGPLGHRAAILSAIRALVAADGGLAALALAGGSPSAAALHRPPSVPADMMLGDGSLRRRSNVQQQGVRSSSARRPDRSGCGNVYTSFAGPSPRRPASAGRPGIIPPDPYLGPASGKVCVQHG